MEFMDICGILFCLAAVFAYINYHFLHLPSTIGIMLLSLATSLVVVIAGQFEHSLLDVVQNFVHEIDFGTTLMEGMLSYLLFAGALHVNLDDLSNQRRIVAILASVGVVVSTFLIGGVSWWLFRTLGMPIDFVWCLIFGALIAPTDPVAVLGILKQAGAPKTLATKITGESLFNDGVGVVVYLAIMGFVATGTDGGHGESGLGQIIALFAQEAIGGIILGFALGTLSHWMLKSVDNYQVEILISLAMVTGGYRLAIALHMSGPLAMVVVGLLTGNHSRRAAMSDLTWLHLNQFWELIDEILNALLFLLIGLELFVLDFSGKSLIAGIILIPICLGVRYISVLLPVSILRRFRTFTPGVVKLLTWGGLRGGISVALALGLPDGHQRDIILLVTYVIVIFSISVQGLTLRPLIQRTLAANERKTALKAH